MASDRRKHDAELQQNLPVFSSLIFVTHRPVRISKTIKELNTNRLVDVEPHKFNSQSTGETLKLSRKNNYWGLYRCFRETV